ncbi:SAM-dependent methyltransferase [Myxacorys almedinensis]|uniref:Methyltransferase domain-containing protein n=1 Tax=Myxacorys almedinensis A TaxID=2690445 RepID=A0A8J7Z3E2_9CYAN|nr:class I SAM-dependent methyltransferase [Myxacorys almedinensis]NDJ15778.1 methyltransferase domain-containing protein [Myxacorys almedinensis A]
MNTSRFCHTPPQRSLKVLIAGFGLVGLLAAGCTQDRTFDAGTQATPTQPATASPQVQKDVPYVPTPQEVVNEMLQLANVGPNDVLYDLGSGDGRIVITAAQKFGTRGVGVDIDPERVAEANANAQTAGVTDRVEFRQQDLFQTDLREATVVTLYLLPEVNQRLRPKLFSELKPGTRIVSHAFDMGNWKPEQVRQVNGRTVYYWTVPETIPENLR